MSREVPILLSAPMVRANRAGLKWQTRRKSGLAQINKAPGDWTLTASVNESGFWEFTERHGNVAVIKPRWHVGDVLWVRETWGYYHLDVGDVRSDHWPVYAADGKGRPMDNGGEMPWRPSIYMPRWACRDTYTVTGVRCERLQGISEDDAIAEGAMFHDGRGVGHSGWRYAYTDAVWRTAREAYQSLWESINGPGSWDANPWVWVIEYDNPARTK